MYGNLWVPAPQKWRKRHWITNQTIDIQSLYIYCLVLGVGYATTTPKYPNILLGLYYKPSKILGYFGVVVAYPQNAEIKTTDRKTETSQCAGQALGLSTATPQHI